MPNEHQDGQCPFCLLPAAFYYTSHKDRKAYDCSSCGPFQIGRKAERAVAAHSETVRKHFSARISSVPDGHFVDIYCPTLAPDDPAECKVQLDYVKEPA